MSDSETVRSRRDARVEEAVVGDHPSGHHLGARKRDGVR
jgi:hypothetical protein